MSIPGMAANNTGLAGFVLENISFYARFGAGNRLKKDYPATWRYFN